MLKKDTKIKMHNDTTDSFTMVKRALTIASILISPDFTKSFMIFFFVSDHTIAATLLQKNAEGHEQPISFFSRALRDASLKYNIIEKHEFELVKALKDFKVYIFHSHIIAFVPSAVVKDILTQTNLDGRRGKWISTIPEWITTNRLPVNVKELTVDCEITLYKCSKTIKIISFNVS